MNTLLLTDVYKMGHMEQYPEGTTNIYSYLHSRSDKKYDEVIFFGLQYFLKEFFGTVTREDADEFIKYREMILGSCPDEIKSKIYSLADLGYWPLRIKAHPEGKVLPAKTVFVTVTNTHPDFYWCVGFVESLLLHLWAPITVASASLKYKKLVTHYSELTCDNNDHIPFQVHDFGFRSVSSNETANICGAAHLINFLGTDTVSAVKFVNDYYGPGDGPIGLSVPATEHSVMCAYGKDNEIEAFDKIIDKYPSGIVSIVSDTYDIYNAVSNISLELKEKIEARDGKVVFRPDSGNQKEVLCGTKYNKGVFERLGDVFGYTINNKGFKVLNPKVGVIYGDGMTLENFTEILDEMKEKGWASSNLVIGVGGLLLQSHSRDDLGMSFKATRAVINGKPVNIFKDPVTDSGKKSMSGFIKVVDGVPIDNVSDKDEREGDLITVFEDGVIIDENLNFDKVRVFTK